MNSRNYRWLGAVALVGAGAVAVGLMGRRSSGQSARPPAASQPLPSEAEVQYGEVDRRLSATDRRIMALEGLVRGSLEKADRRASSVADTGQSANAGPASDLADMSEQDREALVTAQTLEAYGKHLLDEGRDRAWAGEREQELRTKLGGSPDLRVLEATCGSTLCRVQVEHDAETDPQEAVNRIVTTTGTMTYFSIDNDHHAITVYAPRPGQELPRLAAE